MAIVAEGVAQLLFHENGRLSADLEVELATASVDQQADGFENAFLELRWEATTAAGAVADVITFTIDIDDSPDNVVFTTRKTLVHVVTVDDNDAEHTGYVVVPIENANGRARYIQGTVIAVHTGSGSISASAGSLSITGSEARANPQSEYDILGFGESTINP